jgi:hypothetical protein
MLYLEILSFDGKTLWASIRLLFSDCWIYPPLDEEFLAIIQQTTATFTAKEFMMSSKTHNLLPVHKSIS